MGQDQAQELVTVVIPARNEEAFISTCLDSVVAQDYRNLQIIVVDGNSQDRTAQIVKEYAAADPRIELLTNPHAIVPSSLNLAVAHARARWMVRIDAHATVPVDYVRLSVEHLRSGGWAGVGGRKDGVGVTPAGRAIATVMQSPFGVGNSVYHHGTAVQPTDHVPFGSYDLDVVRRLGGWDERLAVNQDFEFDYRIGQAGGKLLFDPRLRIDWHCRQSVPDLYRQYRRYGRGKVVVAQLHPKSLRPRQFVAPALVAVLTAAGTAGLRRPRIAALAVAPYLAGLSVATAATAGRLPNRTDRLWVGPAFAAMHIGWGVGFWRGIFDAVTGRDVLGRNRRQAAEVSSIAAPDDPAQEWEESAVASS